MEGFNCLKPQSHYEETVQFLALRPRDILVLIRLNFEGWNAELILESPESSTLTARIGKDFCKHVSVMIG